MDLDDDLTNELLGLGDEEEESDHSDDSSKPRKPTSAAQVSRKRASPESAPAPPKKRSKPAKKARRRRRDDSDEDDDEDDDDVLSQSSDDMSLSNGSDLSEAEMIQSDEEFDNDDLYPIEGKYKDAEDKDNLMEMPEFEREQILFQRAEEIRERQEKRQLASVLKQRNQGRSEPRAARRSTRTKSAPQKSGDLKKSAQLSELMKKREEKSNKKAAAADDRKKRKRSDDSDMSEVEEGEEEEEEEEEDEPVQWAKTEAPKKLRDPTLDDFNKLRLGRREIVKYWHYWGFEDVAKDCFVRFSLGPDKETGQNVYRMCRIKGFDKASKPYELSSGNSNTKIDRVITIAIGESTRTSRMDVLSDGSITEDELRWYKAAMDKASEPLPTIRTIERKFNDIRELITKSYTGAEMSEMLKRRQELNPNVMTATVKIKALSEERRVATYNKDEDEIARIDRDIEALQAAIAGPRGGLSIQKKEETQMEKLARINQQNRKINMHEVRKAELAEKRRNAMAAKAMATNGGSASVFLDPFARVKTRAKVFHENKDDLFGSDIDSEAASKEGTPAPTGTPGGTGTPETKNSALSSGAKKKMGVDDVVASMGLDIEI